jgi:biotin carboxylase
MDNGSDRSRPLLLLVGSGARRSREFILESVSRRYRLWLLHPQAPSWELPYLAGFSAVDNTDPKLLVEAAREVAASADVAGVFCYDEGLVWPAAHVSEALGLTGNHPEAIWACRDKKATRARLAAAGVPQPLSIAVGSLAEAGEAAGEIGYPVVLKPRGLAGSKGVCRADGPADLAGAYAAARAAFYPGVPVYDEGVLVEDFIAGPEISIDSVFFDGACTPLVLARKQVAFDPFFEETGHVVDANDPLLAGAELRDLLERSHAALDFRFGVTHTEFKLTPRGMRLVEVNARIAGGMIAYLGILSSGVDTALAAADAAAARPAEVAFPLARVAGIRFLYPPHDMEVTSVAVRTGELRPPVHRAVAMTEPGAVLRLPPRGYIARYGYVIAVADRAEPVAGALSAAADLFELTGRRLESEEVR